MTRVYSPSKFWRIMVWLIVLALNAVPNMAQQLGRRVLIDVNDPRPLKAAIESLENQVSWPITYEDPQYAHDSDVADVTQTVRKDKDPAKPKVFVPRGGRFTFSYDIPTAATSQQQAAVVNALLEQYRFSGFPGEFRVIATEGVFHVVPFSIKNRKGMQERTGSILSGRISVPRGQRNTFAMIQAILTAVSHTNRVTVVPGMMPLNLLSQVSVTDGADNESARVVLLRTLAATGQKLAWQLLYQPGPNPLYALNIHFVKDAARP